MWNVVVTDAMRTDLENRLQAIGRDPTVQEVKAAAEEVARAHLWHGVRITVEPDPANPGRFLVSSEPR